MWNRIKCYFGFHDYRRSVGIKELNHVMDFWVCRNCKKREAQGLSRSYHLVQRWLNENSK